MQADNRLRVDSGNTLQCVACVCSLFSLFTVSLNDDGIHMERQRPDRSYSVMTPWGEANRLPGNDTRPR